MPFITQGKTNWKFLVVLIILAVIIGSGILLYVKQFNAKMIYISQLPAIERNPKVNIQEEIKDEDVATWPFFKINEYGYSMKIPSDYEKKEEKEIEKGTIKFKVTIYSKGQEEISITDDKSKDIQQLRAPLLQIDKNPEKEFESFKSGWNLIEPDVEIISLEKVEKGNCLGIQTIGKRGAQYERDLILTSLNLQEMYLTVSFKYYKETESKVLKIIETIECTK